MVVLQKIFFFAGCAVFPIYLFPTGGIQISHALLAFAALLALFNHDIRFSRPAAILLALGAIAFSRETFAIFSGAPRSALLPAAYLWYNMAIFVAVQTTYAQTRSVASYKWGFTAAVAIALATLLDTGISITGDKVEHRASATFHSANQFAYFTTVTFSLTVLLYTFGRLSARMTTILLSACIVLTLASLSKSGIIGMILGLIFFCISALSGRMLALVGTLGIVALYHYGIQYLDELLIVKRLEHIGTDWDDSFAARGYFALLTAQQPLQLWFGLGEHGVRGVLGREVHSTYLAFFGLYGLAGGIMYLAFLCSWVRCLFVSLPLFRSLAIAFPPMFYGIAHNGTRFSVFYILAALSFCLCEECQARVPGPGGLLMLRRRAAGALGRTSRKHARIQECRRSTEI